MFETGTLIKTEGTKALVSMERNVRCSTCSVCGKGEGGYVTIEAENSIDARAGEKVRLHIDDAVVMKGIIMMYGIPLVSLLVGFSGGVLLGKWFGWSADAQVALAVVLGIALIVLTGRAIARSMRKREHLYRPRIVQRIS